MTLGRPTVYGAGSSSEADFSGTASRALFIFPPVSRPRDQEVNVLRGAKVSMRVKRKGADEQVFHSSLVKPACEALQVFRRRTSGVRLAQARESAISAIRAATQSSQCAVASSWVLKR
jgi:hypothetical protein